MAALDRLLAMPLEDLSGDHVESLLSARVPEGRHIEYKSELVDDVLHDIAALANTYGGLVLIGVTEKNRRPEQVVGVVEATVENLVNKCIDRFEPPFVPEIKTVEIADLSVVVIRVDPAWINRPVVINGTVYVRQDHRNARADRERMRQLFSEAGPTVLTPEALAPVSPTRFWSPREPRERVLLVGAAIGCAVRWQDRADRPAIGTRARRLMKERLETTKLLTWLKEFALRITGSERETQWEIRGHNTTMDANLWWNAEGPDRFLPPAGARCVISLPGRPQSVPGASLGIHVGIPLVADADQRDAASGVRLLDLYQLLQALITTLGSELGPTVWDSVLTDRHGPIVGPTAFVGNAHTPLFELVDASPLQSVDESSGPAHFQLMPVEGLDLNDERGRDDQVKAWLTEMLLDGGYLDAEDRMDDLLAGRF